MFSPYYALARRRDPSADPHRHCAFNVALYGDGWQRWAMTERGTADLQRDGSSLQIGPSRAAWQAGHLAIDVDEITAPWPSRLRGRIEVLPRCLLDARIALDAAGRHHWSPIAMGARIEVAFERPRMRWTGHAYLDSNRGTAALEADFARWDWSRAALRDGRSVVLYDVTRRGESLGSHDPLSIGLCFDERGRATSVDVPQQHALPRSAWQVERTTRCDAGTSASVRRTLEDGPFYTRSLIDTHLLGQRVPAVHESLSLDRFGARWVQALLPLRMPRRAR